MTELSRLTEAVRGFSAAHVTVIGDLILDEYVEGPARRISPEAPVQVVSVERAFYRLGGAANVAHITATLGAPTRVAGCLAADPSGAVLRGLLDAARIEHLAVVEVDDRPTTRKLRVLAQHQQLIRLDWEHSAPVAPVVVEACGAAGERVARGGAIIVSDYGKGVVSAELMARLVTRARHAGVPLVVDPKSRNFSQYAGATVLTPNLRELEAAVGRSLVDVSDETLADIARRFIRDCGLEAMVVTLGHRGMLVVPAEGPAPRIAAMAREVFDVTGAGDVAVAVIALGLAQGLPLVDAAAIANAAAGIVVAKIGTAVVHRADLIRALSPDASGKVISRGDVRATVDALRFAERRVVFTNGCFDLLHAGHLSLLREAAKLGDALIVGINSDASVRRLKGPARPLVREQDRAQLVAALDCVSAAVVFDEDTPLALLEQILPDVLVKGADYTLDTVVGRDLVEAHGGRVELVTLQPGYSTTRLIEMLRLDAGVGRPPD